MSDVRLRMRRPGLTGPAKAIGTVSLTPVRAWGPARGVEVAAGVLLPDPLQVTLTTGTDTTVTGVEPCDGTLGWCWQVTTVVAGRGVIDQRHVLVPAAGVHDLEDLVVVDAATLRPVTHTPAWDVLAPALAAIQQAVDTVPSLVAGNPDLLAAAAALAQSDAGLLRDRGWLTASHDLTTVADGIWKCTNAATATAVGLPTNAPGAILSVTILTASMKVQLFIANNAGASREGRVYIRQMISGTWGPWTQAQGYLTDTGAAPNTFDLDSWVTNAYQIKMCLYTGITGRPVAENGIASAWRLNNTAVFQEYRTINYYNNKVFSRRGNIQEDQSVAWQAWERMDAGGVSLPQSQEAAGPVRKALLRDALRARKGGTIGTGGRAVISLRFDDAGGAWESSVLPLLEERGLPFTRVTTLDRLVTEGGTWAGLQTACLRAGGEVMSHGKTHLFTATTDAEVETEILGGLAGIRAGLPRMIVDCFTPPGGGSGWGGYLPSETVEQWATTHAGRIAWAHHALATGYSHASSYHPLDGVMRDGETHWTCDIRDYAYVRDVIDQAVSWGVGLSLLWHADRLDTPDHMTMVDFVQTLDDIVELRDQGQVLVLTVSGQACADKARDYREDLLTVHSGSPLSTSVVRPNWRTGVRGSTRELVATVTGTPGATVTSVVSESTKTHTIPASGTLALRHPATIPTDVTTCPVSITGGAVTDAHLYPV